MEDGTGRAVAEHIRRADHLEDDGEGAVTEGEIDEVKQEQKKVVRLFKPSLTGCAAGTATSGGHIRQAVSVGRRSSFQKLLDFLFLC